MKVLIYNEYSNHQKRGRVLKAYPQGLHIAIKEIFDSTNVKTDISTIDDVAKKFSFNNLKDYDAVIWWGHSLHDKVPDEVAENINKRVNEGMGAIFLHSAHFSKPFIKLMGTSCSLRWREASERERVWIAEPSHPIAAGVEQGFVLAHEEMYGEHFDIPMPDAVVFIGWFKGGEVFRTGCTFTRGEGRIFYLQCGHETFPIYYNKNVRKIIHNATLWAAKKEVENDFIANPKCINPVIMPESFSWLKRK